MNLLKRLYGFFSKTFQDKLDVENTIESKKYQNLNQQSYNLLPQRIKNKYNVTYSQLLENGLTIIKCRNEKWGVLDKHSKILIRPIYESVGLNTVRDWFICVNFNGKNSNRWSYFVYDLNGQLLSQNSDYSAIRFDSFKNVICSQRNEIDNKIVVKYGLLNDDLTVQMLPKYDSLIALSSTRFKVLQNYKWGIINQNGNVLLEFEYQSIYGDFNYENVFVENEKGTFQVDANGKVIQQLPYTHFFYPESNTYAAPNRNDCSTKLKTFIGKKDEESAEYDEMDRYFGKWGIIDLSGEVIVETKYDFVDFFRSSDYFKIIVGAMTFDWKEDDSDNDYDMNGGRCGVIGLNDKIIIPPKYNWIEEISGNLFAVNLGGQVYFDDEYQCNYWEAKGGKWGVINHKSQLIVPIEYDTIMLNWFRVKNYIFVQNDTSYFDDKQPYDVYDFEGNKITKNKPKPKDNRFYP